LIFLVAVFLLIIISTWSYFNIEYLKNNIIHTTVDEVDRLGTTIKLGTRYAMMLNARNDINTIINDIGRQEGIEFIRIFNKKGQIKFSKVPEEVDRITNIKDEACIICHVTEPPLEAVGMVERRRFLSHDGGRMLGVISPIYNEPTCWTDSCHVHPPGKKVLGALDVVVSLAKTDREILAYERWIILLAIFTFISISTVVGVFFLIFIKRPITRLIHRTQLIGQGTYEPGSESYSDDEIGALESAIDRMGGQILEKQDALNKQRHEYQQLFEQVPCYITVQDRDLRVLRYNKQFTQQFSPSTGDYCYELYKGRSEPCEVCPVLMTFEDGESHYSEETGVTKDGQVSHWIVRTATIKDTDGEITAVMEISIDITQLKRLEEEIRKSEEKYRAIFNNIPNPVFVLDRKSLAILDCNDSVKPVYGYTKEELIKTSFLKLFEDSEHQQYALELRNSDVLTHTRQNTREGRQIYVNIRRSPFEYMGREAFLVTASDITKRLMAEQQLIQASKMATLGEMATGIAHELNQPLSVIKTASNFFMRKLRKGEKIQDDIMVTMAQEIDSHVDRASKIINHLREFGRKSEVMRKEVDVNVTLRRSLEIFSQQLKLREIEVIENLQDALPPVMADANRLEQVFINLLLNARDAIEEKQEKLGRKDIEKKICLRSHSVGGKVVMEVSDTGMGIPATVREKIFEPFFTTKRVGKGTGLGLSISYGIIQDYEGTIRVETREGEGTTFIIEFPMAAESS
jgi:histidine kinase